ncbi:hypothetical protein WG922_11920 [Ramlibacter sp. AN1015]|uniref:hypothetical protein n=1 Tax=Ramlibacter sp. AN1015 TaxID=3133428 RepID=UPI0030BB045C
MDECAPDGRTEPPAQRAGDPPQRPLQHALRGALGALLCATEVLEITPSDSPQARDAREVVRRQALRLAELVEALGDPRASDTASALGRALLVLPADRADGARAAESSDPMPIVAGPAAVPRKH